MDMRHWPAAPINGEASAFSQASLPESLFRGGKAQGFPSGRLRLPRKGLRESSEGLCLRRIALEIFRGACASRERVPGDFAAVLPAGKRAWNIAEPIFPEEIASEKFQEGSLQERKTKKFPAGRIRAWKTRPAKFHGRFLAAEPALRVVGDDFSVAKRFRFFALAFFTRQTSSEKFP